jgi:hypothetical protein
MSLESVSGAGDSASSSDSGANSQDKNTCLCGDVSCDNGGGSRPTCFWFCEHPKHVNDPEPQENRISVTDLYEWDGDRMMCDTCSAFTKKCADCGGAAEDTESVNCPYCGMTYCEACDGCGRSPAGDTFCWNCVMEGLSLLEAKRAAKK